jgi:hypothetical protein
LRRRDGILRSSALPLGRFLTQYSEHNRLILIQAHHPDTKELLGYIRFTYASDGYGQVEATNRNARLEYRHLKIGGGTKSYDDEQSGKHGEGFKVAALVFRRSPNNHTFRIESSGVNCNFIFNQDLDLACTITRMSQSKLDTAKTRFEGRKDGMAARPTEDVAVYIGQPRQGKNEHGCKTKGNKVHKASFLKWLEVTLDINPPNSIVKTRFGDLILDPAYKGKFYLQGLLLPSGSTSGKEHRYGYNFIQGSTSRDRDSLSKPGQETRQISNIWSAAILDGGKESANLLAIYTNLLTTSLNEVGDASLSNYQAYLSRGIVERVWDHMRTVSGSHDGLPAFYYAPTNGNDVSVPDKDHTLYINSKL